MIEYIDALPWWGLVLWGVGLVIAYAVVRCHADNYYWRGQ